MKLYINDQIFDGTPEEIFKIIDLIERAKGYKVNFKPLPDSSTESPYIYKIDGKCNMHNMVCCPLCK